MYGKVQVGAALDSIVFGVGTRLGRYFANWHRVYVELTPWQFLDAYPWFAIVVVD